MRDHTYRPASIGRPIFEMVGLFFILAISSYLRFFHLQNNPGWYSDEGTWAIFVNNLISGQNQYLGILNPNLLFAKLPLFAFLGSLMFPISGDGISAVRNASAALGTLNVLLIYVCVRFSGFKNAVLLSLLSSFLYGTYNDAIIFSRLGFSYNLLATWVIINFWGLQNFIKSNRSIWLWVSVSALGFGLISEVMGFLFLPASLVIFILKNWKRTLKALVLMILPVSIYLLVILFNSPNAVLFDINFIFFRVGKFSFAESITLTWIDFYILLGHNYWILPGIIGIFLINPVRLRQIFLFFIFTPLLLLFRTVSLSELALYYMIPFWPLICVGLANFILVAIFHVHKTIYEIFSYIYYRWERILLERRKVFQWAIVVFQVVSIAFLIFIPLILNLVNVAIQADVGFPQSFMGTLVSPKDARNTANYINEMVKPDDLVIASPVLASLLDCNTADFQTALAYEGLATEHLPGDIPLKRYAYPANFIRAKYVISDPIWTNWALREMPTLKTKFEQIETWPIEYQANQITVYRNPLQ